METSSLDGSGSARGAPTAADATAVATAAASDSAAALPQQPTAAEPESEEASIATERGNSLPAGKPLAKHTVRACNPEFRDAECIACQSQLAQGP